MSTNFPSSLDTFTTVNPNDPRSGATSLSTLFNNTNDAISAIEAKVGVNSSAVTTSHDYKLSAVTGSAKALTSGTSTQSVANLTLVTPTLSLGGDATGDMYYRNAGGALTRLPIGTAGQIIQVGSGGVPEYVANPAAADASTTVKGVVEIATTAEINAGTGTGGTGAKLVVTPDALTASNYVKNTDVVSFGGTGADGALNITSGTTTIDCANQKVKVLNYTSVSITGTGQLAFSNPATTGTIIIIKSQGAVTITSSTSPAIDLRGMGAAGGSANNPGTTAWGILDDSVHGGSGTTAGVVYSNKAFYSLTQEKTIRGIFITPGSGGSGGKSATGGTAGGAGGNGGGALYIQSNGALNITSTINVSGNNGSNGSNGTSGQTCGGGGGGGAAGMVVILYKTLTANSATITASGGSGGSGGNGSGGPGTGDGTGGGGGGCYSGAGGAGGTIGAGFNGGNGAAGAGGGGGAGFNGNNAQGSGGTSSNDSNLGLITQYIDFI